MPSPEQVVEQLDRARGSAASPSRGCERAGASPGRAAPAGRRTRRRKPRPRRRRGWPAPGPPAVTVSAQARPSSGCGARVTSPRRLERPQHLRGHHRVGGRVVGQPPLGDRARRVVQPGQRGQQHELDVRQAERLERRALGGLPPVGDLPEQQARAVVRLARARVEQRAGHAAASTAARPTAASRSRSGWAAPGTPCPAAASTASASGPVIVTVDLDVAAAVGAGCDRWRKVSRAPTSRDTSTNSRSGTSAVDHELHLAGRPSA